MGLGDEIIRNFNLKFEKNDVKIHFTFRFVNSSKKWSKCSH